MTMGRTIVSYPAVIAVYFVFIGLLYPISANVKILYKTNRKKGDFGKSVNITCEVLPDTANITWKWPYEQATVQINETQTTEDVNGSLMNTKTSTILIPYANTSYAGNYTCTASLEDEQDKDVMDVFLDLHFTASWVNGSTTLTGVVPESAPESAFVEAWCVFEAYNCTVVKWYKQHETEKIEAPAVPIDDNPKRVNSTHKIPIAKFEANGTYICEIQDGNETYSKTIDVLLLAKPKIVIGTALGISTTQIYLNWTVYAYNSEVLRYDLKILDDTSAGFVIHGEPPKNTSYVINGLKKFTNYTVRVDVQTKHGSSNNQNTPPKTVATLDYDPVFVPKISINGFSATSVTIGWKEPDPKVAPFIHYYILEAKKKDENVSRRAYHSKDGNNLPYMFDNLEPHSTYVFTVCAGSDYTGLCGNWSDKMEAATSDGTPTKPTNVTPNCKSTFMNLTWGLPERPNAEIKGYTMELTGNATFRDRTGKKKQVTWGPLSKFTTNDTQSVRIDDLQPYTNYTVRLSAITRTRRRGEEATASCTTLPAPPDHLPRPRWRKILQDDKYMFKMYLPRITERNGPICCYRVYMVRLLPHSDWKNLPMPTDIKFLEHKNAHAQPPELGAYITDIFSNDNFPSESELVMGDEKTQYNQSDNTLKQDVCSSCLKRPKGSEPVTTTTATTTSTTMNYEDFATEQAEESLAEDLTDTSNPVRTKRTYDNYSIMMDGASSDRDADFVLDGPLDNNANYTLFVELITHIEGEQPYSTYSDYVNVLMPAPTPPVAQPTSALEIALQATCAVAALVLLLMILFCIRQTRRSRKMPPHAQEMNPLRAFRNMFGRPQHTPTVPPDMAPIPKDELATAYAKRQADSDYEFQKEFELLQMLPDCFSDRTTHASEARENQPKNRYPDIKAYDQTRVKLSQIDGIAGSDYINANYVMGYQDRKQFICAQGPTDTTVNDFWRMIWEHGLELIVMLTNLEEYSKVKCSKYWPDEVRGSKAFGGLTVHHVTEKRYSDYIVRELKITKQPLNSEGQPIVEGNGIAKRNGDCKEASEGSVPTSPREVKDPETRIVKQYHFLMWKDFAAPEHAYSILKFIKRVNEAWSGMLNRACVVHCSAGVGRTGTLVALDCLLQQLRDVGHAAVFNTVAELRRSRNFLVQSLKQYVFVYRALVEYAHFEDTEIPAQRLKNCVDLLRSTPQQTTSCLMELEFEKILNSPIPEPIKSCAAGAAEELRPKNRCLDILPYDRNRVILAPIPGRDYSTYINASFIEAYDNSEGFIITQDPMPSTIMDFWRMVSEHNITTIVMLSELGDNKCPRYWDDGTAQYEHISVQYEESESCPYYTRRQFRVVNNKSGCTSCVRQLQYQGWPTAPGHVPEVTRGLAELADCAAPRAGAMLVHCHLGTERSALFVALCILICQLRTERRVDVCCVARKVRSQRVKTINTFLQYEFLHRAILNYAELHNLLEDS